MRPTEAAICEWCRATLSARFGFGCCDDCSERLACEFEQVTQAENLSVSDETPQNLNRGAESDAWVESSNVLRVSDETPDRRDVDPVDRLILGRLREVG
jgi:hypothetical protein